MVLKSHRLRKNCVLWATQCHGIKSRKLIFFLPVRYASVPSPKSCIVRDTIHHSWFFNAEVWVRVYIDALINQLKNYCFFFHYKLKWLGTVICHQNGVQLETLMSYLLITSITVMWTSKEYLMYGLLWNCH